MHLVIIMSGNKPILDTDMTDKVTAKDRYDEYDTAIDELQKKLATSLKSHRRRFERSGGRDWGFPGDLAHIHELLTEAADFLTIETEEE